MHFWGTQEIKVLVKRCLEPKKEYLRGKTVIDVPAGSGFSAQFLQEWGAHVQAYDLFPDFFKVPGLVCERADLSRGIPAQDGVADLVLMQEGIEHLSDQLQAFKESNRVLKTGGTLIVTTPNYSNLRSRLSYAFNESEFYKLMPPNEIDSIWVFDQNDKTSHDLYFGHIFNIGIQKLRVLSRVSGFSIQKIHSARVNKTSLLLFPLLFPFVALFYWLAYRRALRKRPDVPRETKKVVYRDILKCGLNLDVLLSGHLIVEFKKECGWQDVRSQLIAKIQNFDAQT